MSTAVQSETPLLFDVTARDFDDQVAQAPVPVLVDFWAPWCGPCQHIAPILESLVDRYQGRLRVAKVNVDEEGTLAAGFNVRSIPTLVLFHDGKVVEQIIGLQPEAELIKLIDKYVETAPDGMKTAVQDVLLNDDQESALAMLREALQAEPGNAGIIADIARAEFALGRFDDAHATLSTLPKAVDEAPDVQVFRQQLAFALQAQALPDMQTLKDTLADDDNDNDARYALALRQAGDQKYSDAMPHLLTLLGRDIGFADGQARITLISIFDILGGADERVQQYRRQLSSLLN
ncbi:MAG: thioredoxin [Pseudomonadota bacterium]